MNSPSVRYGRIGSGETHPANAPLPASGRLTKQRLRRICPGVRFVRANELFASSAE